MNILILFSQPWKVGGAETHVEALIKGLSEHKVFLAVNLGSQRDKLDVLQKKYPHVTILEIQARGINIFKWWCDLGRLAQLIRQHDIHIISAQQRTAGLWAYYLYKKIGIAFTVTMHDAWHRAQAKKLYAKLFPRMVVVGQHLYDRLVNDFGFLPEQITCIRNGVDFSVFVQQDKQNARKQLGLSQDEVLLLHVSRLSTIKGAVALSLVQSLPQIMECIPSAKLAIIGEGPLRSQLDNMAYKCNEQYGKQIVQTYNFTDEIITWYNGADVVIGEGRVAIEALACHKPVVAIRNGKSFLGLLKLDNIIDAVHVNFDGSAYEVTPEEIKCQTVAALQLTNAEISAIAQYVQQEMSMEKMGQQYIELFETHLKTVQLRNK